MINKKILKKTIVIITFIAILALYIVPIFYKGLFFKEEYSKVYMLSVVTLCLSAAVSMIDGKFFLKVNGIHIGILIIIIGYIATYSMAIFPDENIFQVKRYLMFLAAVISSYLFFTNNKRQMIMLITIYFTGVFIAIISIDYFAERKFIFLINDILEYFNIYGTSILRRFPVGFMAGVFQYSNLYASYTMIIFFIGLALIYSNINNYIKMVISSTMFVQMYLFILTISRGGYLVWAIVFVLYFTFYKGEKGKLLIKLISLVTPSFALLFVSYNNYIYRDIPVNDLWMKTLVAFLLAIAITLIYEYMNSKKDSRLGRLLSNRMAVTAIITVIGFVVVFVAGLIAVHIIGGNYVTIVSINNHGYYFKIWLDLVKKMPLLGYGADSWQVLSSGYNFEGYIYSIFPHSYLLKTTIEIGVIGVIGLLVMIYVQIMVLVRNVFVKESQGIIKYTLSFVTLGTFAHAAMDFIFVYGYAMMIYFLLLSFAKSESLIELGRKKD